MSMSTMTPEGEAHIPNGWAGQIDSAPDLDSNRPLENGAITEILQRIDHDIDYLSKLRANIWGTYGFVTLTDSESLTEKTGFALPATEKNAALEGTLANLIKKTDEKIIKSETWMLYSTVSNVLLTLSSGQNIFFETIDIKSFSGYSEEIWNQRKGLIVHAYNTSDNNNIIAYGASRSNLICVNSFVQGNYYVELTVFH